MGKKLYVYKGFSLEELEGIALMPLMNYDCSYRINVRNLDDDYKREIMSRLMTFSGEYYITYEEFVLIQELGEEIIRLSQAKFIIIRNTIFPEYYPYLEMDEELSRGIHEAYEYLNTISDEIDVNDYVSQVLRFYGDIKIIEGMYFISYKNSEKTFSDILTQDMEYNSLKNNLESLKENSNMISEYIFEFNAEIDSYLRLVFLLTHQNPKLVGIKINDKIYFEKYIKTHFIALINKYSDITFYIVKDKVGVKSYRKELLDYLQGLWRYQDFKKIEVYKNPDENKEVIQVSQGQIIEDIVQQAEKAIDSINFKDVFITAPTGAGKSVIFQIAALYLAEKFERMTIIISPLIALMKDQVKNLHNKGIYNAAYINSELNFIEKENILNKIRSKEIDILYLAPETLLSYTIENFIGDRKIGLFIVDEAHIVTTWGKGFRPDYWYLGKYLSKVRTVSQSFPIVTFTATAVYGGNDDMYDETIESLNMKSTLKYLGNIKRNDIFFDINVNLGKIGKEEYDQKKLDKMKERLSEFAKNNQKTIAYFPYASLALDISGNKLLENLKNNIAVYTAQLNKNYKNISEEEFSSGKRNIMFATKAFGMGIDINDIQRIYHYAPTGNLNDYIQEIGRAARREDILGVASIDFMDRDFSFVNMLFGMSSIKQYQAKAVLKKIYTIYEKREKRNFMVTPNDFSYIFTRESRNNPGDLERKLKTVLLMLEKDLEQQFRFPVMISRPKSMFSKSFVVVDKSVVKDLLTSKYAKYFTRLQEGRNSVKEGLFHVSDLGDVYSFNLRGLWEDHFPDLSFASFKYLLFSKSEELNFPYKDAIYLRYKISIQATNKHKIKELKDLLQIEIEKINKILDNFKDHNKMFSIQEFSAEINKLYNDREKSFAIASSYIDLISPPIDGGSFIQRPIEFNKYFNKYRIVNRTYHNAKRDLIIKSDLMKKLNIDSDEINLYYPKSDKKDFDLFRVLYLLELFGLSNYEIIGGESPEIYIRLNDPLKIKRLTSEGYNYKNEILMAVKRRHENSTSILRKFFTELKTDEERWNFVEDYFLGYDVIENDGQIKDEDEDEIII